MVSAIGAQILWGIFPAFIKLFQGVIAPQDFVAHRAVWSFVLLIVWMGFVYKFGKSPKNSSLKELLTDKATVGKALLATVFIVTNWLVFVWAVNNDHSLDASLGYYICPLLLVLLGVLFLRERLGMFKWIAIGLAALGVTIMTLSGQSKVWIGLVIAVAFSLYALIKKKTRTSAAGGLTMETGFMLIPAVLFLAWRATIEGVVVFPDSVSMKLVLLLSGPMTVAPLFLYAVAVKHVSLSTIGLLQFIGPTLQFLLGVFVFSEPFDSTRLLGFVFVWIGVGLYLYTLSQRPVTSAD